MTCTHTATKGHLTGCTKKTKTVGGHKDNRTTDAKLTPMQDRTMTITDTNTNMTDMINPTHATTVTGTLKEDEETHDF